MLTTSSSITIANGADVLPLSGAVAVEMRIDFDQLTIVNVLVHRIDVASTVNTNKTIDRKYISVFFSSSFLTAE